MTAVSGTAFRNSRRDGLDTKGFIDYFVPAKKILSDKDTNGSVMIYLDTFPDLHDTVMIFFPSEKVKSGIVNNTDTVKQVVSEIKQDSNLVSLDPLSINHTGKDSAIIKKDTTSAAPPLVTLNNDTYKAVDTMHVEIKDSLVKKGENKNEIAQRDSVKDNQLPVTTQDKIEILPQVVTSSRTEL